MIEEKIRIGFKISKKERDQLEILLRMVRLLNPGKMSDNEWRRKAFALVMSDYFEWMPKSVVKLARNEPAELERRMEELVATKGRELSKTGQLQAIRRWRADMSIDAQAIMKKATLVAAIEETKPIKTIVKEKPVKKKVVKDAVVTPMVNIEKVVEDVIGDFIKIHKPDGSALVTCDPVVLRTQIISLWQAKGFLMRIKDNTGQKCWAWIGDDYDLDFPTNLIIEDIGGFEDLTTEEGGDVE